MKAIQLLLTSLAFTLCLEAYSQSCTSTTNDNNYLFFTSCEAGSSYILTGDYSITVSNNSTLKINGNVTINGTLTVNMVGSGSIMQVLSPYTLTATNIVFSGSATGKNLIVDGPSGKISVSGNINFGGLTLDLDGTGSISAGTITGAGNVSCSSDGSCPNPTAASCDPPASSFCTTGGFVTPVELLFFKAAKKDSRVDLNWATSTEFNFDYFDIERSQNGTNFISIGKVNGHGTTNERQDYQFADELPFVGKNYYRLKSVDFDLYTEIFDVIAVEFAGEKQFHLSPNPSDGNSIAARINFAPTENASVIVYDNVGSIVGKFELTGNESGFTFSNQLKSGVYYAKFSSDGFSKVSRFLVRE